MSGRLTKTHSLIREDTPDSGGDKTTKAKAQERAQREGDMNARDLQRILDSLSVQDRRVLLQNLSTPMVKPEHTKQSAPDRELRAWAAGASGAVNGESLLWESSETDPTDSGSDHIQEMIDKKIKEDRERELEWRKCKDTFKRA